jgi:hypothetical protein
VFEFCVLSFELLVFHPVYPRRRFTLSLPKGRSLTLGDRTLVMGIINVTPDSFSDGGQLLDTQAAIDAGMRMVEDGADLLDIGGESTRPGAQPTSESEERRRVLPVIEALAARVQIPISLIPTRLQRPMPRCRRAPRRQRRQRPAIQTDLAAVVAKHGVPPLMHAGAPICINRPYTEW